MLRQLTPPQRTPIIGIGLVAVLLNALAVWQEVLRDSGIAFGVFDMASVLSLVVAGIVLLSALNRPLENLFVVILMM